MSYIEKIKVLLICPDQLPKIVEIPNTLRALQKNVDGKIEVSYLLDDKEVCLICNDEGKINGALPNRSIGYDIIYGNFLIVGDDYTKGDFKSLTDKQIAKYQELFNEDSIVKTKNRITAKMLARALLIKKY